MQVGDYICVKGKRPDWLDREKGRTFPDFPALIVELKSQPSIFQYCVMKTDGSLWNISEKQIRRKTI